MLKISEPVANDVIILKLEGRLIGPWVAELKRTCGIHLAAKRSIQLDFADVTFADRTGLTLLLFLRGEGVRFVNCSPFLEQELRTAATEK